MLQLLRDYRNYHAPFGSSLAIDETGVKDANYGPAGLIETGAGLEKLNRDRIMESYEALDEALDNLKHGTPLRRAAWLVLLAPYLGDPADPSLVQKWRETPGDCRPQWHDRAVDEIAYDLRDTKLYVVWPHRMTTRQEKAVDKLNDEFYAVYSRMREEGTGKTRSVQEAAKITGYSESAGWRIVKARETRENP